MKNTVAFLATALLFACVGAVGYAWWTRGSQVPAPRDYELTIVFPSAEGISVDSPATRDGVQVGKVAEIALREEGGVLIRLSMDATRPLTHRYLPQINRGNFMNAESKLEFVRADVSTLESIYGGDTELIDTRYSDGEFFQFGRATGNIFEIQDDLQQTLQAIRTYSESFAVASESINELAANVQATITNGDATLDNVADRSISMLEELENNYTEIRMILTDPEFRKNLRQSLERLPVSIDELNQAAQSFERAGDQYEKVGLVAEEAFGNLRHATGSLANDSERVVEQYFQTMMRLEQSAGEVESFSRALNRSDGFVQSLANDDEFYWQIRQSQAGLDEALVAARDAIEAYGDIGKAIRHRMSEFPFALLFRPQKEYPNGDVGARTSSQPNSRLPWAISTAFLLSLAYSWISANAVSFHDGGDRSNRQLTRAAKNFVFGAILILFLILGAWPNEGETSIETRDSRQSGEEQTLNPVAQPLDRAQPTTKLSPTQVQIAELRFYHGMTMAQIAKRMNLELRTVLEEWAGVKAWARSKLDKASILEGEANPLPTPTPPTRMDESTDTRPAPATRVDKSATPLGDPLDVSPSSPAEVIPFEVAPPPADPDPIGTIDLPDANGP